MNFLNKLLTVFALSIGLLSSCSKNELVENKPLDLETSIDLSAIDRRYIDEIKHSSNVNARLALETLSPEEKFLLWQDHVDGYLARPDLSPDLRVHILKLKSFITVALYKNSGTVETEVKMAKFLYEWYTKPTNEGRFTKKQLLEIGTVYGLGTRPTIKDDTTKAPATTSAVAEVAKCECRYDIGCDPGDCLKRSCSRTTVCGIAGNSACTGLCG